MTRSVLLLGAGFSKWSCKLPLVSQLFDLAIHADNVVEEKRLARVEKLYESWRDKNPNGHNEEFVRFAQLGIRNRQLVNWYIVRRLTDGFISIGGVRKSWYINTYRTDLHVGIKRARKIIWALRKASSGGVDIVTTNYDLIPEYALSSHGFNYGVPGEQVGYTPGPFMKRLFLSGDIRLAKLHGSLSWDEQSKYPDARHGLTGKCLIIPPVHEKIPIPALKQQWVLAKKILSQCDILFVFGFSFHPNDLAVRSLVKKNIKKAKRIVFIDLVDRRPQLKSVVGSKPSTFIDIGKADTRMLVKLMNELVKRNS